jgi:DNA-binding NtrC family response regulator
VNLKPRILVIDDEPRMAEIIGMVLRNSGYEVAFETDAEKALLAHEADPFDLVLTDLRMPVLSGLDVLERARRIQPDAPVVLITAHGTIKTAIAALRDGAFDYLQKPFDNDDLRNVVKRALDMTRLARENRYLRAELRGRHALDLIVASSSAMQSVLDLVRRAATSPSTVLITGESGTGKELVARAVHFHSDRVGEPFVAVNCKAFAEGVLESELFGHEKGAFTGADRAREGLFEQAAGGTLFLDEIGETGPDFQAKLLRVLQERTVRRVGASANRPVDVRIVAASNRDLRAEVEAGRFREDLYFRLAVIPIQITPLRERPEDILPLARHFLERFAERTQHKTLAWSDAVEQWLIRHDWPGNVRELENALERGVVLARGPHIELDDLLIDPSDLAANGPRASTDASDQGSLQEFLDRAAAARIREALRSAGGVKVDAARDLGIDRTTLYRLMRKLDIADSDD